MQYITEELYKKMQMFQLPMDDDVSLGDLEEWGIDLDDFFLQELLARDEWYVKYTPKRLKELLFDASGEVIFTGLTEETSNWSERFAIKWKRNGQRPWPGSMRPERRRR